MHGIQYCFNFPLIPIFYATSRKKKEVLEEIVILSDGQYTLKNIQLHKKN